jgi:hypothetical protein
LRELIFAEIGIASPFVKGIFRFTGFFACEAYIQVWLYGSRWLGLALQAVKAVPVVDGAASFDFAFFGVFFIAFSTYSLHSSISIKFNYTFQICSPQKGYILILSIV